MAATDPVKAAHTPTPWTYEEGEGGDWETPAIKPCIADANGSLIAELYADDEDKDEETSRKCEGMKRAVRAVNAHDDLVKALEAVQWAGRDRFRCVECGGQPSTGHTKECRVGAALAKAKGA